jgi:hypothetical protein
VEAAFTKRTSIAVSYDFQWVNFDRNAPGASDLLGGHSHGASLTLRHVVTGRLALTGDYDLQRATLLGGTETFNVQNGWAGAEYTFSELTRVFAAGGISRLGVSEFSAERTGPAWRFGFLRNGRLASVDVLYSRSFVPSYGFGGTMQNEELTGRVHVPLARRMYMTSALSWRRDDPLIVSELPLRSYWIEGSVGYAVRPSVRLEAFFAGTHQSTDIPGGVLDRNRVGIQIITAKPVRIH